MYLIHRRSLARTGSPERHRCSYGSGAAPYGLDWIRMEWIGLDWNGLEWIGLDWIGLESMEFDR